MKINITGSRMAFRVMSGFISIIVLASLFVMSSCANESELAESAAAQTTGIPQHSSTAEAPPVYGYRVIRSYPHDRQAFTQGLVYEAGELYEGTGIRGQSSLRRVALETGIVRQERVLPEQYFGEGITIFGDRIIQLTWQSRIGFVYDKASFKLLQQFRYPTEGWGITHDGSRLIMSDGTANLYFLEPQTFMEIDRIEVHDDQGPVVRLNELEYVRGDIYANVWQTNRIARIDLLTGRVAAWIDLAGLLSAADRQQRVDVLNGIAYDAENDRLFVTGKWWPKLFEMRIVAPE
jgi:glutamine cyclotransferase